MRFIRCRICGETYLASETPSHCPFCGAHRELMVDTDEFPAGLNDVALTEVERNDLLRAIELERSNTRFYLALAARTDDARLSSGYKRLARIEAEHCSVFCKLAGVPRPDDLTVAAEGADTWCDGIAESLERERRASAFYAEASGRATNERVLEVFSAVSAIEADHIELDGVAARLAACD